MLSVFKYRSKVEILSDILETLKEDPKPKTKSQIIQSANLNTPQANKYINMLMVCDLIRAEPISYGKRKLTYYSLTHHGSEFLETLQKLQFSILLRHKSH